MSDTKFTPGPWAWSDAYKATEGRTTYSLIGDGGYGILSCDGKANSPQLTNRFNAALIAAAPALYEALEALAMGRHYHKTLQDGSGNIDTCKTCGKDIRNSIHYRVGESESTDKAKAHAALSLARGESPNQPAGEKHEQD